MPRAALKPRAAPDVMNAPNKETHSTDFQIGTHKPLDDTTPRNDVSREKSDGHRLFGARLKQKEDLFFLDGMEVSEDYLAELAFNEDWLDIVINPSTHKNAADIMENWSNGIGAEMLVNGKVLVIRDLPVDKRITVKRKIVEQIVRARVENVQTSHEDATVASPRNRILYSSSNVHSFTILKDPRGSERSREWLEMVSARPI